jgi:hypothetical protein
MMAHEPSRNRDLGNALDLAAPTRRQHWDAGGIGKANNCGSLLCDIAGSSFLGRVPQSVTTRHRTQRLGMDERLPH